MSINTLNMMREPIRYADLCYMYSGEEFSLLTIPCCLTDLQNVNITLRILFRPQPHILPQMYMNLGEDYDERVLPSITTEVLKAVVVSRHHSLICYSGQYKINCVDNNLYFRYGLFLFS